MDKTMKTIKEMREEQRAIEREIANRQTEAINEVINKIYNHPIAINDEHYEFLKEIENALREYKKEYL